jgi:hypothetical protein
VLGGAATIASRPPGYRLDPESVRVDVAEFETAVAEARRATGQGQHGVASEGLRGALELWRGDLAADLVDIEWLELHRIRLSELRLSVVEDCFDADLADGRAGQLVPELETACRQHPLRERLWGQLMLALYRSGRQGDALRAYQRARDALVEELGVDPGPALQRLERSILSQSETVPEVSTDDPALTWLDVDGRTCRLDLVPSASPITIGRDPANRLPFAWDPRVSRRHAEVTFHDGEWRLSDDGWSSNGTWRNGERVAGTVTLAGGDLLRFGDTVLFVRLARPTTRRPPVAFGGETILTGD